MKEILTYRQFGAVGDGVTDDFEAIFKTHEAANATGATVEATAGDRYYIGRIDRTAEIRTNVNWRGATFIIDDTKVSHFDERARTTWIFTISREHEPVALPIPEGLSYKEGDTNVGFTLPKACMLLIENANHRDNIRYGVNEDKGQPRHEMLLVDKDGNVDPSTPIQYDYDTVTAIKMYDIDDEPVTVKNANFITIANNPLIYDAAWTGRYAYYSRGILCTRPNTTIRNVNHDVTGEEKYGAPYAAFYDFQYTYNVTLCDSVISSHYEYKFFMPDGRINAMGSYEFQAGRTILPRFINVFQKGDITDRPNTHGVMGSNYCRNLYLEGCYIDRFDSHTAMHNAIIRNCTLGFNMYFIGGGDVLIENVTRLVGGGYIGLRHDYNCIFRGNIVVKGGVCKDPKYLIEGAWYRHNNGLPNHSVDNVVIDGLMVARPDACVYGIGRASAAAIKDDVNPFIPPTSVKLKNMRSLPLCEAGQESAFETTAFDTSECIDV